MELYVNGRMAARTGKATQKSNAGLITDITPFLHVGKNSIAVHVSQTMLDRPPAVVIEGQAEFADGKQQSLGLVEDWRAFDTYDRRGAFWFETEFDDSGWRKPYIGEPVAWRGQVELPPRAISTPRRSYWILPDASAEGSAVFARSFELSSTPREGWLRVLSTGAYRLAVNGWIVADDHYELLRSNPYDETERTFDISSLLRSGKNTISLAISTAGEAPRLRADLEATTQANQRLYVATDGEWRCKPGFVADWQLQEPTTQNWQPCKAEVGYLHYAPRRILRELGELEPPPAFWFTRFVTGLSYSLLLGIIAWLGCRCVTNLVRRLNADRKESTSSPLVYLALVPSTVAAAIGWLMTSDQNWTGHDIYQPIWFVVLLALVVVQWLSIICFAYGKPHIKYVKGESRSLSIRSRRFAWGACWLIVVGTALWLRTRDIVAEPIHHDEISAYAFTQGVLQYGFPGGQVHPDLPFGYCSTSELAYYPTALCELFVDDPRLVLRIPAVLWSMATLMLLGRMGTRWFNPYVGLIAAILYALSPHVIGWANLGRYLSQVQFFTLLTTYCTYEAFRNSTPRVGMVWAAAFSMAAMYLSWEGAGMYGIGLALAVLVLRRHDMRPVLGCPSVYAGALFVLLIVAAQNAHRIGQQTQRMWYGEGISDLALKPMWRYPFFDIDFFLMNASWTRSALLPMLAFVLACVMAVRHRWRTPIRFALICLTTNALLMAALLPLRTNRYSYHLLPIFVLIAATVIVWCSEMLWRIGSDVRMNWPQRAYARVIAVGLSVVLVGLASGWLVRPSELDDYVVAAYDIRQMRYPHWDGPNEYLRAHMREGDIVMATFPHTQNFMLSPGAAKPTDAAEVDYWLESTLIVQATLGDSRAMPRDRRSGTPMIYDISQLKQLFTDHDRVWYCTTRFGQSRINDSSVSKFLRENMDVVYEDFTTAVMLRDNNHRTAPLRVDEEEAGSVASDFYLR
jgi:hypothetical protein